MKYFLVLVAMLSAEVFCQRRELEADLKGIASTHSEVISDNPEEETEMSIFLMLTNINDYDTKKQILDINGWLTLQWTDERYSWDSSHYGNLTSISLPCKHFVKPDVKLFNGAEEGMRVDDDVNCIIEHKGTITYVPLVSIHSFCPTNDPTDDTFTCNLKLGSWTHPCHDLNITQDTKKSIDLKYFSPGWRWHLMGHSSEIHETLYSELPEPLCDIEIKLRIKDRSRTPRGRWYYPHCL